MPNSRLNLQSKWSRQMVREAITVAVGAVVLIIIVWFGIGTIVTDLGEAAGQRAQYKAEIADLQGPQEAYRRSLSENVTALSQSSEPLGALFVESSDILSFVVRIEQVAHAQGLHHELEDRGFVEVPKRRRSLGLRSVDDVPARRFIWKTAGSFPATMKALASVEQSLPLVMVDGWSVRQLRDNELQQFDDPVPSLNDPSITPVLATATIRVFIQPLSQ